MGIDLGQSGMPLSALRGHIDHLRTIGDVLECPNRQLGTVLGQSGMSLSALRDMMTVLWQSGMSLSALRDTWELS